MIVMNVPWWWSSIVVAHWSQSTKLTYVGPGTAVSTGMGDHVWVQFPVPDIPLGI